MRQPSLIRVCSRSGLLSTQRRLWPDWVDAQADLSFCVVHIPLCLFCHAASQLCYFSSGIWNRILSVPEHRRFTLYFVLSVLLQIHLGLLSTAIVKKIYFLTISARVDNDSGFISRGKSLITNSSLHFESDRCIKAKVYGSYNTISVT